MGVSRCSAPVLIIPTVTAELFEILVTRFALLLKKQMHLLTSEKYQRSTPDLSQRLLKNLKTG